MNRAAVSWWDRWRFWSAWALEMKSAKELYYWFLLVFLGMFLQAQYSLYHAAGSVTPELMMSILNMMGIISLSLGFMLYIRAGRGVVIPAFIGGVAVIEMSNPLMLISEMWLTATICKYVIDRGKAKKG